ncbi:MAG: hypothetical protein IPG22_06295 [Acidobacteria bacterium]|nr:hypothetical protein [Acidobacteriota bacterium]
MIKDLSDNHLFNNYPCEADDAKIESLRQQLSAAQAKIDELMLECCPDEMTQEQLAEYEKHQRAVTEPKL